MPRFPWTGVALILFIGAQGCKTPPSTTHPSEILDEAGIQELTESRNLMAQERYEEARLRLETLTDRLPECFRAWRLLQDLSVQAEGLDKAREAADTAVEAGRSALTLTLKARLIEDPERAMEVLQEALTLDETYVWAHLGCAYNILGDKRTGEYETARNHLEQALVHSSGFSEARKLLIESLHRLGDYEEERKQYEIYLDSNPFDLDACYNFADLLRNRFGDYEGAMEQLDFVLTHEPDRLDAQLLQAIILSQAGEYKSAESKYLYLSGLHPNAVLNLALLYMDQLRRPDEALKYFQAYLAYSGPHADEKTFLDEKILVPTYIERLKEEMK